MDRRTFIGSVAFGFAIDPFFVAAQQAPKVYRLGVLGAGTAAQNATRMSAFRQALRDLGWVRDRTIAFEERWADLHYERLPALAAELVAVNVDLIFAVGGTDPARAAMTATRTTPVVFALVGDPVGQKIVPSLAHPGGNVTGLTNMGRELYAKRVELLAQAVPSTKRAALIVDGAPLFASEAVRTSQAAARSLGIQLEVFDVRDPRDFEKTFENAARTGAQAVVAGSDSLLITATRELGELALKYRLPLVTGSHDTGVLVAYSVDFEERFRRAAIYVDRILKGTNPGDLPIEQPSRFTLVVNLRTAKALGIAIPESLLLHADEVVH